MSILAPMNTYRTAIDLLRKEYIPVAVRRGTKEPAEKWSRWLTEKPSEISVRERWEYTDHGVAILCKDLLVYDVDYEELLPFVLEQANCKEAPICKTPGGFHVHVRVRKNIHVQRKIKVRGKMLDLLTGSSLSILPPTEGYSWITDGLPEKSKLPFGNVGFTRERQRQRVQQVFETGGNIVERGRAYMKDFPRSVSGNNGHTTAFVAFLKIVSFVRKIGGTDEQAWQLCLHYNATKCDPPWSMDDPKDERALIHKFGDAQKKAR